MVWRIGAVVKIWQNGSSTCTTHDDEHMDIHIHFHIHYHASHYCYHLAVPR